MKENPEAECSKRKESQTSKVVPIGKGKTDLDTLHKEDSKKINTPTKTKKSADGEIVRAYLASQEKNLSMLHRRKEGPPFCTIDLEENENKIVVGETSRYTGQFMRIFTGCVAFDDKNRLIAFNMTSLAKRCWI